VGTPGRREILRRATAISRALSWRAFFVLLGAVVAMSFVPLVVGAATEGLPSLVRFLLLAGVSIVVGVGLFVLALGGRTRAALEAFFVALLVSLSVRAPSAPLLKGRGRRAVS